MSSFKILNPLDSLITNTSLSNSALSSIDDKTPLLGVTSSSKAVPITFANENLDQFGNMKIVEKTPHIAEMSIYGFSYLRDRKLTNGTGQVQDSFDTDTGEYLVSTGSDGVDYAELLTAERGRYQPGLSSIVGIGIRCPVAATGNQHFCWGVGTSLTDSNINTEGFFFGNDAGGTFVAVYRDNIQTHKIYQQDWNSDNLDGTGDSRIMLDITLGNIYQIRFSWYGYGIIEFILVGQSINTGAQIAVVCHRIRIPGGTSVKNPNLPVIASILNDGTASPGALYVGGRQYSVEGKYDSIGRKTSAYNAITLGAATVGNRYNLISFQRKLAYITASIKLNNVDIITDTDLIVEVFANAIIPGTYVPIADISPTETAVEVDLAQGLVDISQPKTIRIDMFLVKGGSKNERNFLSSNVFPIDIPIQEDNGGSITLAITPLANNAEVSCIFSIAEEW